MNKTVFLIIICSILTGVSCQDESDTDYSNIDFSNIANLDKQPLAVVRKCVKGEWKVYYCEEFFPYKKGVVYVRGPQIEYPENLYVEITDDMLIFEKDDIRSEIPYTWGLMRITKYEFMSGLTWAMQLNEGKLFYVTYPSLNYATINNGRLFFSSIKDDTLYMHLSHTCTYCLVKTTGSSGAK